MNIQFLTDEIPPPAALRTFRERLGLSQSELAADLGFSPNKGPTTVRDWEIGARAGAPFAPTKTVWAAFRYLIILGILYQTDTDPEVLRQYLPHGIK